MLFKYQIEELLALDADGLARIARASGYKDAKFTDCEFVGITNGGEFAYKASYFEDGTYDFTKLYVRRDPAGNYVADY